MPKKHVCVLLLIIFVTTLPLTHGVYKIGVGRADCTGPAAEVVMMGYAKTTQKSCGIHLRQYSRAFIFDDGTERAAFVSVDVGMMAHGVRKAVLSRLRKLYNYTYNESNLILSGTHTHGAPGGFLMEFLYDLSCLGFVRDTFKALVDGIVISVVRAHENMVEGNIFLSSGDIHGAGINRSPTAYLMNSKEERAKYKYNVDKEMVQLKLVKSDGTLMGAIHWFPVHPTSMNYTNCLITTDNLGYASVLLEKSQNIDSQIGQGRFVAAFASTNLGDVSPNILGPRCINTGEECHLDSSTCDGQVAYCVAMGPGKDMFESTKIIAGKLFDEAKVLLNSPSAKKISGPIHHIHRYVDMPTETATIKLPNGTEQQVHGCLPAMGFSFAAGTTDGAGESGFSQSTRSGVDSFWNTFRDFLFPATQEDKDCHDPKPILINSGKISLPYEWQPRIVSTQLIQLGEVILIAVPGEFTTMSGRRLRDVVKGAVVSNGGSTDTKAIITGLSNVYSSYIATPEEYQKQRYEGASTIYGPHTLTLYLNIYKDLTEAVINRQKIDPGPQPPDLSSQVLSFTPPVLFDTAGMFHQFGDCLVQPFPIAKRGMTISATFVSGHPRNDVMHEKTFLTIEKLIDADQWRVVATDADWETKFIWKRTSTLIGGSEVTIKWDIPADAAPGKYRIRHFGYSRSFFKGISPYSGTSREFEVHNKLKFL